MKDLSFVLFIVLFYGFLSQAQAQEKSPFIEFSQTNFSIGSTYGVHPNYTGVINASYFQGDFDSRFTIGGIPLIFNGRISNEKYRSGRPSYFKVSYDAFGLRKMRLKEINDSLDFLSNELTNKKTSIYNLESKLSFLNLKQMENLSIPELPFESIGIPDTILSSGSLTSISPSFSAETKVPNVPDINQEIPSIENQLKLENLQLKELEGKKTELEGLKNQLVFKKDLSVLDGIKKVDVGLSGLSQGSLSKNTIPIQGIHVTGVIKKYFYDVAAGLTVPNQMFSTSAFNQLIDNNANVFNVGSFFNVQKTRFVSSGILGYGEKDIRSISFESYYTGRTLEQIKNKSIGSQSLTSNIGAAYTFEKMPFITFTGTCGYSTYFNDTLSRKDIDKLAYGVGLKAELRKISSLLKLNYRSLGSSYDGFTQGIYLNGSEHFDLSLKKEIGRRLTATLRFASDQFNNSDSIQPITQTRLGGIDVNWKLGLHSSFYGTYSLVESSTATSQANFSHLGKAGVYSLKRLKNTDWINTIDLGYAQINGADSIQLLKQGSLKSEFRFEKWFFSTKGEYQSTSGLTRIYGDNWIIEPQIGIKLKDFEAGISYQFLKSEQFNSNNGFQGYFMFKPSPYLTWSFSATKWMPTEYIFFLPELTEYQRPYFFKVKLSIHLNVNK